MYVLEMLKFVFILSGVVVVVCQVGVLARMVKLSIGSVVPGVLIIVVVTSPDIKKIYKLGYNCNDSTFKKKLEAGKNPK